MFFVYILESTKDPSFYIGHTNNLDDRLLRHNSGRSLSTKSKRPWKLIFQKEFLTRGEAMIYEKLLKSHKSRDYLQKLISRFD